MGARADSLASKVEQANNDLLKTVESTSDDQWKAKCADGEWTQGFAGYHAAGSIGMISGMVQTLASGGSMPPMTMADIEAGNAAAAQEHGNTCTKQETLEMIRNSAPGAAQTVRGLSDEQLDRKVSLLTGMPEMSVEQVVEMLMVGHAQGHLESITKAR